MHKDNTAYLGVRGVGAMNKKKRAKVASWLRRQAKFIENGGDAMGKITTGLYRAGMRLVCLLLCLVGSGCVTKYDDIVSDFHTIQNGEMCTTVAHDQRKFNADTKEPAAIECHCDNLKPTRRLVVKAGESPEVMACPAPMTLAMHSTIVPSVQLYHAKSLASTYVPAIGDLLGNIGLGIFAYKGLTGMQPAHMTQSAGSFYQPINTSTLLINGPVPPGVAK
jgi:hypothetical protein